MSLSRRVGSGAILQLTARLGSALVSFAITAVVLARVLDPAEYGRFHFWLTTFMLTLALQDLGVNRAAIRRVSAQEASLEPTILAAAKLKSWIGSGAFVILAVVALIAEDSLSASIWIVAASSHVLTHGLAAGSIPFEVAVDFKTPAIGVLLAALVFLIGGGALAMGGVRNADPYLVAYGAGLVAQNLWLWTRSRARKVDSDSSPSPAGSVVELAREALPLGLSAIAIAVYYYSDTLLLRPLRGEADVARYAVAYRLMTFALMVPVLGSQVIFPVLARCAAKSDELLGRAVERATFYFAYFAASAGATLFVLAEPILGLVFGDRYRDSAPILRVLTVAMMLVYLAYPHTTALIAAGYGRLFTRITLSAAAINVAANLLAIPRFGPIGAATTTLVTEACVCAGGVGYLLRERGVSGFSKSLWPALLVFVVTATMLVLLGDRWPLPVLLVVGAAVPALLALPLRVWPFDLKVTERELA